MSLTNEQSTPPSGNISMKRLLASSERNLPASKTIKKVDFEDSDDEEDVSLKMGMAQILSQLKKLDTIQSDVKDIKGTVQGLQDSLEFTQGQLEVAKDEIKDLKGEQCSMKKEIRVMEEKINSLSKKLDEQEKQQRRDNAII